MLNHHEHIRGIVNYAYLYAVCEAGCQDFSFNIFPPVLLRALHRLVLVRAVH